MTNEVRLVEIKEAGLDKYLAGGVEGCKKAFNGSKGWTMVLNPEAKELVAANGGKNLINEKGLLECLTALKRLVKKVSTAQPAAPVAAPVAPVATEAVVEPKKPEVVRTGKVVTVKRSSKK